MTRRPALLATLGFLTLLPLARWGPSFGASLVQPSDAAAVLIFGALAWDVVRGRVRPRGLPIAGAGIAYLAALALSVLLAPRPADAAWLRLAAYAPFVLLPWALAQTLRDGATLRLAVRAWLLGGGIAVALGLFQLVAFYAARRWALEAFPCNYGRIPEGPYPRLCGPFRNPNAFANYLAATVPLLVVFGRDVLGRRGLWIAGSATATVCLFTLSSGLGGIALAAAIAAGALLARGSRAAVSAGIAAAVAVLVVSVGYRVPDGLGHVPVPGGEWHFLKGPRVHTWLSAVGTVRDRPITGLGYGSTVAHTPRIRAWITQGYAEPLGIDRPPRKDAHQTWLSVAAQAGLVGLAAYLVVLLVTGRAVLRAARRRPRTVPERVALSVAAGLAGALLYHGLFASVEESRHVWALLGLGVAAAAAHRGNLPGES